MFLFPRFLSVLVGLPIAKCALNVLQRSSTANTGASNRTDQWEESVLAAWAKEPACQVSVLRGQCGVGAVVVNVEPSGEITSQVYTAGAGGGLAPFDAQKMTSIFPIASNTKILTSILLVSLADHGKLSMDETVGSFLDQACGSLPQPVANITLFQLASQTSGLPAQPTNLGRTFRTFGFSSVISPRELKICMLIDKIPCAGNYNPGIGIWSHASAIRWIATPSRSTLCKTFARRYARLPLGPRDTTSTRT